MNFIVKGTNHIKFPNLSRDSNIRQIKLFSDKMIKLQLFAKKFNECNVMYKNFQKSTYHIEVSELVCDGHR